ncbi:glycoside hydrolase family 127 protein [Mucilaginibacter sp. UR6-1]|uniref:glycoside hydrolase family 127 protein n=1 Tax=Mucilaginibacter sp. UR6-1 TaxID=1435643 RepID=UPI001E5B9A81|nr:glycoside hydrolase family 127 protein [Mucilaginibacter sp. UR6-1]MCC8408997.1 glycoside hydrolase family 127 protein [Mucilaginibacter sp. UR6-1]
MRVLSVPLMAAVILGISLTNVKAQRVQQFPVSQVRLLPGPFMSAQQTDLKYILKLDADRLLSPYLREAGLIPKAKSYTNWENTGLDGHIGGHYLSALAYMYASTGDKRVKERLDYMVAQLALCQQKDGDGYIGGVPGGKAMWAQVGAGDIRADNFSLNKKWVPLYNIHKTFAGLIDAYRVGGNQQAKTILLKYADWAYKLTFKLSDAQIQRMLTSEHGGMNEVFADVAAISGDKKYLELARRFSHRKILNPLLHRQDSLTGVHANTQIPKVIGYMRVAELAHDTAWANAADYFWHDVVEHRTISIGGNSVSEHFNPINDFSGMIETREGPETCNSYNMLKLTGHLFLSKPSAVYMDYYERTLYNHILSSQNPNGGFVYFTPIRPQHYRVYSSAQQSFWCCVGSGLENHGRYGEYIYAHGAKDIFVNLFIPSTLNWAEKGLQLEQNTELPYNDESTIKITIKQPRNFALHIRCPAWVKDGEMQVWLNNKPVKADRNTDGYIAINRKWQTGDLVKVKLPMQTKAEALPDGSNWVSFVHGPVVLAAATDTTQQNGLFADDSRMGHVAGGPLRPLDEAPLIIAERNSLAAAVQPVNNRKLEFTVNGIDQPQYKNLKLVPFYSLYNTRYMLYWPYTSKAGLIAMKDSIRKTEDAKLKLDTITVDRLTAGEQQPENDHAFKGEETWTGIYKDRHYRTARGWFSYMLKNPGNLAKALTVTYSKADNRAFDVYIDGEKVPAAKLGDADGKGFYTAEYAIPATVKSKKNFELIFRALQGSQTADVFELRLIK